MHLVHDDRLTTRIIQSETEWEAIRPEWDALFKASPMASTPLDFVWLRNWWRTYGPTYGDGGLRLVTFWRGRRLSGTLPLYLCRRPEGQLGFRCLRFISTGEAEYEETCPDYLNLLCLPGEEAFCAAAAWIAINSLIWDRLELFDMPANTAMCLGREAEQESRGACPIAQLDQGFEAYLLCLSAKTRQHARQYLRAAARSRVRFELAAESEVDYYFNDLVRLHQERWTAAGKQGCFSATRFTDFHLGLARAWVPSGRAILARMSFEGRAYAVIYGFISGSKFEFYQSGISRSESCPLDSPGTTANLLLMKTLIDRGVTAYDFLRKPSSYKEHLATQSNPLVGIAISRPTFRSAVDRTARLGATILGKGLRVLKARTKT